MHRDQYGIISQPIYDDLHNVIGLDNGDSAFSTGLSAFGGSEQDARLMLLFIVNNQLVRHPYSTDNTGTAPHNSPLATSRDQAIAFFSGISGRIDLVVQFAALELARKWRINSDVLSPSNKLFLYYCSGLASAPLWLEILGRINLALDILFACLINPKHEVNQITVTSCVIGRRWARFLYWLHPDLFGNIDDYFNGWRTREPIGLGIKKRVADLVF